ncbi:WG repeat-containing protein [Paracrocinitomix mangrovi]|uniref:WG repeat-containing protein n=1 Tax=Paracrocinitomix mangrovi TaxID=2862509 RepID=UPI001C8D1430|nr:WG repeat-containing protein [Paracrocinitomix mangrovi]UKN02939.1 WG repeat-containing protein [Paracrocinitomix mangrovi]
MRYLLFIVFVLIQLSLKAQKFTPSGDKVSFFCCEENTLAGVLTFDKVWGYPKYKKGTDTIISIEPIVYPLPVEKDGKWGAIDKKGNVVHDFNSAYPTLYTDSGKVILKNFSYKNFEWDDTPNSYLSVLDSTGAQKTKYIVEDVHKGSFLATEDSLSWGILGSDMKTLMPFEYIGPHHKGEEFIFSTLGYLTCRKNEAGSLFGVVNYKGKVVIPFKWKLLNYVIEDEDHIYAMNDYLKRGYINIHGQTTLAFKYESVPKVLTDSNFVMTEDYVYFLDRNLQQIGPRYDSFERKGDLYFYKVKGKWGIMDENYKVIIQPVYSTIMDGPRIKGNPEFRSYIVLKYGKYGLIKTDGTEIIKPAYECLCGFSYYAPSNYYIEFKKEEVSYKYDENGTLIEKGGKGSDACFCE